LPPCAIISAPERHRLHGVVERFGTRGLAGRQQQLHHRVHRQPRNLRDQLGRMRTQHHRQRRVALDQRLRRLGQRLFGHAVFGEQTALERIAQLAIEQLALQRAGHRLVARPQLGAADVEDVARGDDALGLAGLEDRGQCVLVGAREGRAVGDRVTHAARAPG